MIIPINKREGKCFQTVVTAALNHEEIKKDLQRTTKLKTFINKCNWEDINIPSERWLDKLWEK